MPVFLKKAHCNGEKRGWGIHLYVCKTKRPPGTDWKHGVRKNVFENSAVWTLESSEGKLASGFGLLDAGNMRLDEVLPNPRVEVV